jgi:hypothetical protein
MKTSCTNLSEIISGASGLKCLFYQSFKAVESGITTLSKAFSGFDLTKTNLEYYMLLISRSALKEMLGADMEIKLLVMFLGGYFLFAKELFIHNPVFEKIKTLAVQRQKARRVVYG